MAIELGDIEEKGRVLHTIGMAYKRLNKPGDALRYYQEALGLRRGIGQKNGIAQTLAEVAEVHRRLGQPAEGKNGAARRGGGRRAGGPGRNSRHWRSTATVAYRGLPHGGAFGPFSD